MAKPRGRPFPKGHARKGGRAPGTPNKTTTEVRELARQLVEAPDYQRALRVRLVAGTLAPAVETMLWSYAYGKPKETVELEAGENMRVELARILGVREDQLPPS